MGINVFENLIKLKVDGSKKTWNNSQLYDTSMLTVIQNYKDLLLTIFLHLSSVERKIV